MGDPEEEGKQDELREGGKEWSPVTVEKTDWTDLNTDGRDGRVTFLADSHYTSVPAGCKQHSPPWLGESNASWASQTAIQLINPAQIIKAARLMKGT